ncbi:uncharacterized protein LOC130721162 isoform X2 [Lotus japonicus]|nr:uncharacterized protein LOC130721162 isoform X2 [Lotus japonicus]XP_057427888.1 uncharacterized protein LOC130721162 isoform X2 [Lotus japonicus]
MEESGGQLRVRHNCQPNFLLEVNKSLSDLQKAQINATPFKWLMNIPEKIPINGNLLYELVTRWVGRRLGFTIRSAVVPFTPLDVCFATGLRIVGESVIFDQDEECHTTSLFNGKKITIPIIVEQLKKFNCAEDVEDFCRLYILLGLAEFYCPNTKSTVHSGLLRTLDDLSSLDKYSWGVFVYDVLVGGLIRAVKHFREAKNSHKVSLIGCAAVLQIWALEHMSLHHSVKFSYGTTFPRFLHWPHLTLGRKKLSTMFENTSICQQIAANGTSWFSPVASARLPIKICRT